MTKVKNKKSAKRKGNTNINVKTCAGLILLSTTKRVARAWYPLFCDIVTNIEDFEDICFKTVKFYNHLIKHRGVLQGTKRFKQIRIYTIKWILGLEPEPIKTVSLNKRQFPRDIMFLKTYCIPESKYIRMVYTILNISRLSTFKGRLDKGSTSSITRNIQRDSAFKSTISAFDKAVPLMLKKLNIKGMTPIELGKKLKFHNSSSKGPNSSETGMDSLLSAPWDAKAVLKDAYLSKQIKDTFNIYGSPQVFDYMNTLAYNTPHQDEANIRKSKQKIVGRELLHSKLTLIPDSENKQRIVAMVDYWTQMLLLPIESMINHAIKKVPNNYMFNQDLGRSLANKYTIDGEPVSLDASDFTDRFPKEIQRIVLKHLVGEELSVKIFNILTKRKFFVNSDLNVKYEVGQPMGAHASFHLANLTHSLVAIWCCMETQRDIDQASVVCGDDIAFRHGDTADLYIAKMQSLKIDFSEFKGYASNNTTKVAEFCKRLYWNGETINGLSPKPFLNYSRDYKYALSCIETSQMKDVEAVNWVKQTRPKDLSKIADLMILNSLTKGKGLSVRINPFFSNISIELLRCLDTISENFSELSSEWNLNLLSLITFHQLKVNEKFSMVSKLKVLTPELAHVPNVKSPIHPITKVQDERDDLFFQKMVSNTVPFSFVHKMHGQEEDCTELNQYPIITPIGVWYLEIDDPAKGHPHYGPLLKAFKGKKVVDDKEIAKYCDPRGSFHQIKMEITVSIFTGMQTTSSAARLRLDDRNLVERDKKQFLFSKRYFKLINEFYYTDLSTSFACKKFMNTMMRT